jgi:transcriptional antiterminator RfaH
MLRWHVIQTKPKKEDAAAHHLMDNSIEVFFPRMETYSVVYGKSRKVVKALFPSYLFAHFDLLKSYRLVNWSRGVSRVLGYEGTPAPVDDEVIEIIRRRADENSVVQRALHFKAKDPVRICSGPLKDLIGIFERWVSDEGRVRVLLDLLNYTAKMELHYSQIEKLAQ